MNHFQMLTGQHSDLEVLSEITLAKDVPTRAAILEELARALIAHTALEEQLLRREVSRAPRAAGLWDAWEGRLRVERITVALAAIDPSDATFGARIASIHNLFEERIEYEETQLFPRLQRLAPRRAPRETPRRPIEVAPSPSSP